MAPSVVWTFEVKADGVEDLAVEATFEPTRADAFAVDDAMPFAKDVQIAAGATWTPAARRADAFVVPCAEGCRVRYHFALKEAADSIHDVDTAIRSGDIVFAPPSTWLLHPVSPGPLGRFLLHVDAGAASRFVTGMGRDSQGGFVGKTDDLDDGAFSAFGPVHVGEVKVGGATLTVGVAPDRLPMSDAEVLAWVRASAGAVAAYYEDRLPARRALIFVMEGSGGPTRGKTLGPLGPAMLVRAGEGVTAKNTRDDWVVTHELLHVNFPYIGYDHAWLTEGLATYIEPIARARVGLIDAGKVWRDMIDGMPQGLPEKGDRGLENTPTWGRTYWGGGMFCLVADVTIREQTGNRKSLDDVLRAIGRTGATVQTDWTVGQVLDAGDAATGTRVLHDLYAKLALAPGVIDLDALWAKLGVRAEGASVAYDDHAPLAAIRRAITAPVSPGSTDR